MPSVDEGEEVFFDTVDQLISEEESVIVIEDLVCNNLKYDVWLREPVSVKERRKTFLCRMGMVECSSNGDSETMEMERATETSGTVSSGSFSATAHDNLLCERQESNSEANCSVDYSDQDWLDDICMDAEPEINQNLEKVKACIGESANTDKKTSKKLMRWWSHIGGKMKRQRSLTSLEPKLFSNKGNMTRIMMEQNKKRCIECSAVYTGQEISAHHGLIWTLKFSPDGQYLASGGEDGVICVWRVGTIDASSKTVKCNFGCQDLEGKLSYPRKMASQVSTVIPEKIFYIEEEPLQKFRGHSSDVLDLAWSTTNHLLSSSRDKTVRLWQVGSDKCLGVFHHCNYVTSVQFNPVDENYFISGSIDGKVRIWGVEKKRVEDWANIQDLVTAVCYQPNGKGFVVGSISGTCSFFETSGGEILLNAATNIHGNKSSGKKITGIQFLKNDSRRVMITSEDSKIRILDGLEVVRKYQGLTKSGSQMLASFTSNGKHIVSVGNNSRVYLWNYEDPCIQKSKQAKSIRSCEHFFFEGISVAIPWMDPDTEQHNLDCSSSRTSVSSHDHEEASSRVWDSERFSLAHWFSMDRGSMTWPQEKLPLWDVPSSDNDWQPCPNHGNHFHQQPQRETNRPVPRIVSATWGLVFVTAHWDGTIRTFSNYGLPVRN